ncbi:zona pellucida sperm-binding protein 3-like [Syngnathoides biaculeatus]|uniref:zona pellucida sperm-binding protein 3-like n=1 Tax=Syngnathoides biaculeatus TaxID=300417 RepID=UPI002ADE88DD|nr:zona pellucida sperm-binding protein 3-like [Syngnathoides biaculeatus]
MSAYFLPFLLLLSSSLAIRTLKDGPMIDKDGREYKSPVAIVDTDGTSELKHWLTPPVQVMCTPTSMIIQVKAAMYGVRRFVSPGEIFLGGVENSGLRQCQARPVGDSELLVEAELQHCGTELSISDDSVIYSNRLTFLPAPRPHGITRNIPIVVPVSCHYKRTHIVSSQPQIPVVSSETPSETLAFSLKVMSDDWTKVRPSNVFYLGDKINVEASYTDGGPEPRRLFIDSCVATLNPDATSVPRYFLIENNGCLTDSRETGSRARFLARARADVLQLQLDAFLFQREERNTLFLTCQLRATVEMWRHSPVNKACSYVHSRWENVDGGSDACLCCDGICKRNSRHLKADGANMCEVIILGPLLILPNM